jgi:hypothetical protein
MTEHESRDIPEISKERYRAIREAVESTRSLGITNRSQIREAVINAEEAQAKGILTICPSEASAIPSVARQDIRQEENDVRERAFNKYLRIVSPTDNTLPVAIEAVHAVSPNRAEILYEIQQLGLAMTEDELSSSLERIHKKEELSDKDTVVKEIKNKVDSSTGEVAFRVAELTGIGAHIAKQSRIKSDMNRYWYNRRGGGEQISIGSIKGEVYPYEYPRSAKAALYWAYDKLLREQNRLDEEGRVTSPFCRLSIHGMKDNPDFDIAIGAGKGNFADEELLKWLQVELEVALIEQGLSAENKVILAHTNDPNVRARDYIGSGSLADYRKDPTKYNEYLQSLYSNNSTDSAPENKTIPAHPGFGNNFNTAQIEIYTSARVTQGKEGREKLAQALAKVVKRIPQYFESHTNPTPS